MRRALKFIIPLLVVIVAVNLLMAMLKRRVTRRGDPAADEFDIVNIVDGTDFASHARALRGGSVRNIIGGVEVDLRGAELAPGGAHLEVETRWGGTRIIVPPNWRVDVTGRPQAGAHEVEAIAPLDPDAPLLSIEARTAFGALEVTNGD